MPKRRIHSLVLSVYATTRGYAYTLFESILSPVDWGVKEVRGLSRKNALCLESVIDLAEQHQPDVVVLDAAEWRTPRIKRLYQAIEHALAAKGIEVRRICRADVKKTFKKLGAVTKQEMATMIAKYVPAFDHLVPPPRRAWMSEHPRMGIFSSAALAFAYFDHCGERLG